MIFSFRYGEAKVLPTQKVMIFYYFTVESLISLLATNKKFLAGKKKNLKRFFHIFLLALNRIFWKTLTNKPLNLHYKVKITKNNKIEKVSERILVSNTSSFRQVRNQSKTSAHDSFVITDMYIQLFRLSIRSSCIATSLQLNFNFPTFYSTLILLFFVAK